MKWLPKRWTFTLWSPPSPCPCGVGINCMVVGIVKANKILVGKRDDICCRLIEAIWSSDAWRTKNSQIRIPEIVRLYWSRESEKVRPIFWLYSAVNRPNISDIRSLVYFFHILPLNEAPKAKERYLGIRQHPILPISPLGNFLRYLNSQDNFIVDQPSKSVSLIFCSQLKSYRKRQTLTKEPLTRMKTQFCGRDVLQKSKEEPSVLRTIRLFVPKTESIYTNNNFAMCQIP